MSSIERSQPHRILVVDDEPDLRTLYELTLLREGYQVEAAGNVAEARRLLAEKKFAAVITDMRLPDGLGLDVLKDLAQQQRLERCVVITAFGSAENAVEALKAGAFDYLTKPVDLRQFRLVVASAVAGSESTVRAVAQRTPAQPTNQPASQSANAHAASTALERMVGDSLGMRQVKERIGKVARSMAPVLVRGESGSGKELVARAVHACSHRASGPFVAVNCGAIPENLMEAEFFGAKKGSYTGAMQDREGYFQAASGGTLFLDEIGDLPLAMQSKLLRAIQERRARSLGSTAEDVLDVRVVSATHKDIGVQVQTGLFRQDLYYRLNVIEILLPPLRERRGDLPLLCECLLQRIAQESALPVPAILPTFYEALSTHPLQGNIRELENLLHRALALSDGAALSGALLEDCDPAALAGLAVAQMLASPEPTAEQGADAPLDLQAYLDQQERVILVQALQETGFNRTVAAQRLGLSLRQIRYRMQRLGISAPGGEEPNGATEHAG